MTQMTIKSRYWKVNGKLFRAVGCCSSTMPSKQSSAEDCLDIIQNVATGKRYVVPRSYTIAKNPIWVDEKTIRQEIQAADLRVENERKAFWKNLEAAKETLDHHQNSNTIPK